MTEYLELAGGLGLLLFAKLLLVDALRTGVVEQLWSHLCLPSQRLYRSVAAGVATGFCLPRTVALAAVSGMAKGHVLVASHVLALIFGMGIGSAALVLAVQLGIELGLERAILPALLPGCVAIVLGRGRLRAGGLWLVGVAALFASVALMRSALEPLAASLAPALPALGLWSGGCLYLLAGGLLGVLLTAHTNVVIVLLCGVLSSVLSLEVALLLILGMELGGGLGFVLKSRRSPLALRRVAVSHALLVGAAACLGLLILPGYLGLWLRLELAGRPELAAWAVALYPCLYRLLGLAMWPALSRFLKWYLPRLVSLGEAGVSEPLAVQWLGTPSIALEVLWRRLFEVFESQLNYCLAVLRNQPAATAERYQELATALALSDSFARRLVLGPGDEKLWSRLIASMQALEAMRRLHGGLAERETAQGWQNKGPALRAGVVFEDDCRQLLKRLTDQPQALGEPAQLLVQQSELESAGARGALLAEVAAGRQGVVEASCDLEVLAWQQRRAAEVAAVCRQLDILSASSITVRQPSSNG